MTDAIQYFVTVLCTLAIIVSGTISIIFWLGWKNKGNGYIKSLAMYLTSAVISLILALGGLFIDDLYTRKQISMFSIMIVSIYIIVSGLLFLFSSIDKKYCGDIKI
jgi:hypothetical protein